MRPHNRKLLWSPHSREVFAIGASEHLKLYEFCKPSGGAASASTALQVEDTAGVRPPSVRLLSSVSDVQQLRCVAWCPLTAAPWILAVGTASGRVVLHDCAPTGAPGPTTVRSEFVPGVPRACFAVSWNEVRTNLIAAALDKVRGDSGVVVWDAERQRARGSGGAAGGGAAVGGRSGAGGFMGAEGGRASGVSGGGVGGGVGGVGGGVGGGGAQQGLLQGPGADGVGDGVGGGRGRGGGRRLRRQAVGPGGGARVPPG